MMKKKIKLSILCSMLIPLLFSCAQGFDDSPGLDLSDVNNTQMVSPSAEDINQLESKDGKTMTISWPFAFGSGGYEIKYAVLDVNDQVDTILHDYPEYDGNSIVVKIAEDTKYLFSIKALGNKEYNNTDADETTELRFGTAYDLIKHFMPGEDVTAYFEANPIPTNSPYAIKYTFEPGGTYTIKKSETMQYLHMGRSRIMFAGNVVEEEDENGQIIPVILPHITLDSIGFVTDGAGVKFKNLAFGYKGTQAFLGCNNADSVFDKYKDDKGFVTTYDPIVIQDCNIDFNGRFIANTHVGTSSRKKYCFQTVYVKDCILSYNASGSINVFDFNSNGFIKNLVLEESTIWAKSKTHGNYFYQPQNVKIATDNPTNWKWAGGLSVEFHYCTLYQVCKTGQIYNNSNIGNTGDNANVKNEIAAKYTIFVDTGNKQIIRRLTNSGNANVVKSFDRNTYWYDGSHVTDEISTNYDSSGTHFTTDPNLLDPSNGDFTVRGLGQKGVSGDPRWW